jgi:hypothetical protein
MERLSWKASYEMVFQEMTEWHFSGYGKPVDRPMPDTAPARNEVQNPA